MVVGGGDGTVSAVAAALLGIRTRPSASGARQLQQHRARFAVRTRDGAIQVIADGRSEAVDCGWVVGDDGDGTPFFEAAGVGLDAIGFIAVELAEHGWWHAMSAVWRSLRRRRTPMRVTIDGTAYRTGRPP